MLSNEDLTFKAIDGSGFKSVLGTFVRNLSRLIDKSQNKAIYSRI